MGWRTVRAINSSVTAETPTGAAPRARRTGGAEASYWRRGNWKARSVEVLSGLAAELVDEGKQGVRASCSGDDHE